MIYSSTIEFILKRITPIVNMRRKDYIKNDYIFDIVHGIDMNELTLGLVEKKVRVGLLPISYEAVRAAKYVDNKTYVDIFKMFPHLLQTLKHNEPSVNDRPMMEQTMDAKIIKEYDVFIISTLNHLNKRSFKVLQEIFRDVLRDKMVIFMYDRCVFDPANTLIEYNTDLRSDHIMNSEIKKSAGIISELANLTNKVRNDTTLLISQTRRAYSMTPVKRIVDFELEDMNRHEIIVVSIKNLPKVVNSIRNRMGYDDILPYKSEMLVAYNFFSTFNEAGRENEIVRKGTPMRVISIIDNNVLRVDIDGVEHNILYDTGLFYKVLKDKKVEPDADVGLVFYAYAISSHLMNYITFNDVYAYLDMSFSENYLYTLIKMARKKIQIEYVANLPTALI